MSTLVELPRRMCRMCGAVYVERDFHPCNGGSDPFVLEEQSEYHRGYLAGRASGLEESAMACDEEAWRLALDDHPDDIHEDRVASEAEVDTARACAAAIRGKK